MKNLIPVRLLQQLLKQYKDPLDSLALDRKKRIVYEDFFCDAELQTFSSRYFRSSVSNNLQGISNRRQKRRFDREVFFLAIRRMKKSSAVNSELTTWKKMDQPGKVLREKNEFSSTTTASKGLHHYWKLQNVFINEEVCKIAAMHNWIVNTFNFDFFSNVLTLLS